MKVLFLGGNLSKSLSSWLISIGEEVIYTGRKIDTDFVKRINPEFIISYNYRYIIPKDIIEFMSKKIINLHISYLPYNKEAYPNIWSFLEDTPKGVTIHYIDEGIDTGDIVVQKEIFVNEDKETLRSSYEILHRELQTLFKENWERIKKEQITPKKQTGEGSKHYKRDFLVFELFIKEEGWNTSIKELKEKYNNWKNAINRDENTNSK